MKTTIQYLSIAVAALMLLSMAARAEGLEWEASTRAKLEAMAKNLEETLKPWPVPDRSFEVETYGAVADGKTLNTVAIQQAIDACSAAGGGVVRFGQGDYVTGTIDLKSGVMLEIAKDSRILGSLDLKDYPDRVARRKTVMDTHMEIKHSLIFAEGVERVGIRGPGMIDFRGTKENFPGDRKPSWGKLPGRPFGMRFLDSSQIVVQDIHLKDSPSWMQCYMNCEDLILEKVHVLNQSNHNQDAFDIDGCRRVIVRNCFVNSRDDGICLKGLSLRPLEDLLIENCTVYSKTNPLKIGTDTQSDFRRILARNLILAATPKGMPDLVPSKTANSGITLATVDGGDVEDILITDVTMKEVPCPIFISVHNRGRVMPDMPAPPVGKFRRVIIENVTGSDIGKQGSFISGIKEGLVENVVIRNVDLKMAGGVGKLPTRVKETPVKNYPDAKNYEDPLPSYGFFVRYARHIHFENINVTPVNKDVRPPFSSGGNIEDITLDGKPILN